MTLWITMIIAGTLTYLIRLSFIKFFENREMPAILLQALRFVPPAVLTAILVPELLLHEGSINISLSNPRLLAGCVATLVAWRTRNVFLTIIIGMLSLWVIQYILIR